MDIKKIFCNSSEPYDVLRYEDVDRLEISTMDYAFIKIFGYSIIDCDKSEYYINMDYSVHRLSKTHNWINQIKQIIRNRRINEIQK